MAIHDFSAFFTKATGHTPYPYQRRLADEPIQSRLVHVPTGCGKTAAVILAWLYQRQENPKTTPRRLVYCLPMRVLVEQTYEEAVRWLDKLEVLAGTATWEDQTNKEGLLKYEAQFGLQDKISVHLLMGGEEADDWDLYPEREAIIIGTQDMMLSRALNRGYAMSRYRWPMHFGLLNNDCLWVMDEIQLMDAGLGTACQLEAFRCTQTTDGEHPNGFASFFNSRSVTWYMSATASEDLLASRDWRAFQRPADFAIEPSSDEKSETESPLGKRRFATKRLQARQELNFGAAHMQERAAEIVSRHSEMVELLKNAPADLLRRTLIICNTVERAVAVHNALRGEHHDDKLREVDLVLLHSRFRPPDRKAQMGRLNPDHVRMCEGGQIVVATQVIEAGVDISSAILWTEVAPLASLAQRFGRLNRAGEFGSSDQATHDWTPQIIVVGIELPPAPARENSKQREEREKRVARCYLPYDQKPCETAWPVLQLLVGDASPAALESEAVKKAISESIDRCPYSLQRHELLDFFDTDSNLSLGYTDVTPFVRGLDNDIDVYVLWREWDGDPNEHFKWDVQQDELCGVPVGRLRSFMNWRKGWLWLGKERGWVSAQTQGIFPGATLLLPAGAGGYVADRGWTGKDGDTPHDCYRPTEGPSEEELLSYLTHGWRSVPVHTDDVRSVLCGLLKSLDALPDETRQALFTAVDWHDVGKGHEAWSEAAAKALAEAEIPPPSQHLPLAKFSLSDSPRLNGLAGAELKRAIYGLRRLFRPGVAHEVASALALRQWHIQAAGELRSPANLAAYLAQLLAEYLVMSHHGHVRKVLRDEIPRTAPGGPKDAEAVRGISEGDPIPSVPINGQSLGCEALSVRCRQMGRDADSQESYTRGVLRLLDHYGPFRLAYLEAILRGADARASEEAGRSFQK